MSDAPRAGVGGSSHAITARPRRRYLLVFAALAATAAVVAWVLAAGRGGASHPITAGPTDPMRPTADPMFGTTPELTYPRLSSDAAARYASAPWKLLGATSHGSELHIGFAAGVPGCSHPEGVYVLESPSVVVIATLTSHRSSDTCTSALTLGRSAVRLAQPLGSRTLRHASIADDWKAVASSAAFAF